MAERADKVTSIKQSNEQSGEGEPKPAGAASPPARRRPQRRGVGLLISLAVVIIVGFFGFREFQSRLTHVFEQDARIAGNLVTISSRVSGWVTAVSVEEAEPVSKGQVLVNIDDRESKLRVVRLRAQLSGLDAEHRRLEAARQLADGQISSRIKTRMSELNAVNSSIDSLRPQVDLARSDFRRAQSLFAKNVVSKSKLDQDRASMQRLEGDFQTASAELQSAEAKLREARAEIAQLKVLDSEIAVLDHRQAEIEAELERQQLDLEDRTIRSPSTGVIDRTFVEIGEYVTPGQRLALLHDPNGIWVEANIKETEIRRVKVGQSVEVHVDAYPDIEFTGTVKSIGNAATSEFALLPSPNPSGNFTKTTQRLRTLISVEQHEGLLRPGMMVEVSIKVR